MKKVNDLFKNIGVEPIKSYGNTELMKKDILNENKGLCGIYRWINEETGDTYVGSATNLANRIRRYYHESELKDSGMHINRALLKHGHDKFKLEILEYCDKEKLIEREQYFLDNLNPSYNILKEAYSLEGFKHSAETIESLKEREFTQEHKDNLSLAGKGRIFSEETLTKLSESLKEHRKHNPLTPEALSNIKEKTTEREGVPVKLINQETGEEKRFETQTDAGSFLGMTRQAIRNALRRKSTIAESYKVEKIDKDRGSGSDSSDGGGD